MPRYVLPKDVNNPGLSFQSYMKRQLPKDVYLSYQRKKDTKYFTAVVSICVLVLAVLLTLSSM